MKSSQTQNQHLMAFDPVYPKNLAVKIANEKQREESEKTGMQAFAPVGKYMRQVHYGGCDEPFEVVDGVVYNEDGTATVNYYDPNAKLVQIRYRAHNYMKSSPEYRKDKSFYSKDYIVEDLTYNPEDGYWSGTINPGPGYHSVFFIVDGVKVINMQAPYHHDDDGIRNCVDIPDDPDTQLHDVPHGSLTREIYFSKTTGRYRCCWVYTPASYAKSNKEYPVLYIQHGGTQNETSWFAQGKLDMILDNLIARGEAEEMIVVTNNGYVWCDPVNSGTATEGKLDDVIINECIPYIENKYRVVKDRRSRAAAGLSMGGGHARRLGLGHPDVFANVGLFSSGECFPTVTEDFDFSEILSDAEKFNETYDAVTVACGDADPRFDQTYEQVSEYINKGFNIKFVPYKGQHEWNVWRYCAKDFVQRLFKK